MSRDSASVQDDGGIARPELWLGIILVTAAILRITALSWFPEIEADEGLWTNSAKNFVLFGDWFMDGRRHVFLAPVYHGLSAVAFWIFGPSIEAARALSAISGVVSTLLIYLLLRDGTDRTDLALFAAALFAFSQWTIIQDRKALIESVQLAFALGSALFLVRGGAKNLGWAGLFMGLALLTKLNIAFLLIVFSAFLLLEIDRARWSKDGMRLDVRNLGILVGIPILVAGLGYGLLYLWDPVRFVGAFQFELDGVHFLPSADPIINVGRFGLTPERSGRSVIGLFREDPILWVLATVGAGVAVVLRPSAAKFFGLWVGFGLVFLLAQLFQPTRYFYLLTPAVVYFGALALSSLGTGGANTPVSVLKVRTGALAACLAFNLSYTGMNAVANYGTKLTVVERWIETNTHPEDRILAAGYFATNLPNRAYAHYYLAENPEHLLQSIAEYDIDYVVYDDGEWREVLRNVLEVRFRKVEEWPFGAVYRVDSDV